MDAQSTEDEDQQGVHKPENTEYRPYDRDDDYQAKIGKFNSNRIRFRRGRRPDFESALKSLLAMNRVLVDTVLPSDQFFGPKKTLIVALRQDWGLEGQRETLMPLLDSLGFARAHLNSSQLKNEISYVLDQDRQAVIRSHNSKPSLRDQYLNNFYNMYG